jgi:hypothetical protein
MKAFKMNIEFRSAFSSFTKQSSGLNGNKAGGA